MVAIGASLAMVEAFYISYPYKKNRKRIVSLSV
jgi:hypothetical protein